jgi:hemoglobin
MIMPQKKDIESRKDIELLVDTFYKKALKDEIIGYIFNEVAKIDLAKHMPTMYNFWETTLFHKASYKGNPMKIHVDLHAKEPLKKEHFDQWLSMFSETVNELFHGEKAELAKTRALSIATVMQIKIHQASEN